MRGKMTAVWIRKKMCRGDREIQGHMGGPTEGKEMEVSAAAIHSCFSDEETEVRDSEQYVQVIE